MLVRTLTAALAALTLSVAVPQAAPKGQEPAAKPEAEAAPQPDAAQHQAMLDEMTKLAAPGPEHAALKAMEGTWKAVVKSWFAPGQPEVTEGVSENRLILGGRYLEQHMTGTMMGMPFEGYGLTGYDNLAKRYVFMWVDNMGTGLMTGGGSMDEAGRSLTTTASVPGPDGKPADVRMVTKILDDDTHVYSMYGQAGGQEQLMLEITYTRK